MFEELRPEKEKAIRAYIIFSILFFIVAVGTGFVLAADRGYGAFPWNSDTTVSCNTPGGPYYSSQRPRSEQHCPSPVNANFVPNGGK
ncbi:MAG: hypothetical protein QOF76_4381 [Solirubrobacteraceae bacterium]|nr:hypothetical protein [Solirubrobacteraceae bacterium]